MRILHIGSDSIHVSSYISALQEENIEQFLVSEEQCGFEHVIEEQHVSFRKMIPGFMISNKKKLQQFIAAKNPDIIHIHQVNRLAFFAAGIASKLEIPVITTAWGSDVLLMPKKNFIFRFLVKSVLKKSGIITADSRDMIEAMQELVKSKTKYINLQYGITPVESVEKEKIVYSNRLLKPLYRIDQVLKYFADFSKENTGWKLIIGGSGAEEEQLRALFEELELAGNTEFTGFVDSGTNRSIYAKASIFISIPESDGTSVSLLEAMSAGCIPVVSDLAVSKEWITDGSNGIIEKQGINPLKEALLLDREKAIAENTRIVEERATRKQSISTFKALYGQLLTKRNQ